MVDVHCPVLAIFGEDDIVQPTETSAARFEEYLTAAGNSDFEIIVIPGVGHDIDWTTPGYDEAVSRWREEHKEGRRQVLGRRWTNGRVGNRTRTMSPERRVRGWFQLCLQARSQRDRSFPPRTS
jgi:hypothetical protein